MTSLLMFKKGDDSLKGLFYDLVVGSLDRLGLARARQAAFSGIKGSILEAGVGTGRNIFYYPGEAQVVAIDISGPFLSRAKKRARQLRREVTFVEMDVERLAYPDDYFDFVIATCVLCSAKNPLSALAEMKRVCKPGGGLILVEHVKSRLPVLGSLMTLAAPLFSRLIHDRIDRDTAADVVQAGWALREDKGLFLDVLRLIRANKI